MNPLARHVGRRDKRKGSFMKARMGKHQLGALENGTSNQQQIHVEWPWTPTLFRPPVSSSGDLHLLGGPQQFPNSAAAIKHQRGIQIIRLRWAYGPRLVETRDCGDHTESLQVGKHPRKRPPKITHIAAEADQNVHGWIVSLVTPKFNSSGNHLSLGERRGGLTPLVITPRRALGVLLGICACGPLVALASDENVQVDVAMPGSLEVSDDGFPQERFQIPPSVAEALTTTDDGRTIAFTRWPVAPGRRQPITVKRHRVVDPKASLRLVDANGTRQLAPSARIHFWGTSGLAGDRIMLSIHPIDGSLHGFTVVDDEVYEISKSGIQYLVRPAADRIRAEGGDPEAWSCSLENGAHDAPRTLPSGPGGAAEGSGEFVPRSATIAFDTDTELLQLKFNNSQAAALDYIADLVAAMNVMYEHDLDVTLLQGDTIIRMGSDPYVQNSGGNASSSELNEFGSYWNSHYDHIDRALAAMLSGKQPGDYSASGIAWVGGLCSHNYGYSFTKVFKIDYLAGDAFVAGHELGHNFGSRHTHCYTPPIDQCYANEGGCYSGPTSCPGGPGTVMSYCHVAGCGSNRMEFHSRVISNIINNHVNPATGICIFNAVDPLFTDGFESGGLGAWSTVTP